MAGWEDCHTGINEIPSAVQQLIPDWLPFTFSAVFVLASNLSLLSADYIVLTSQRSSSPLPSSSSSSKPSALVPHLSLYLYTHPPVTLGDFQLLSHTRPNPSTSALEPVASYAWGPPSIKTISSRRVNLSLSCEVTLSPFLCSCLTGIVPYHHGEHHYLLSCLGHIPGLFNPCLPPL